MDVMLQERPTLSKDLKRLAGFVSGGLKGFDMTITNLQVQTYITVHSFDYAQDKQGKALRLGHRPLRRDGGRAGGGGDLRRLQMRPGGIQRADHPAPWTAVPRGVRRGFGKANPLNGHTQENDIEITYQGHFEDKKAEE